jgi:serine phosphatase RsbU (regulator of sigma subunit)
MSQSIADFRIRSMMCAPLVNSEGTAFGVLQVDTLDQRNKFRTEDLEVLAAVASQASIAIDNAQLHEQALARREMERDLLLSRQVQRGFLPHEKPRISGYEFYDFYQPANHVGGDYFDYILLPDGRLAVLVADVVGHGIAAALLMAKLSAEARFSLASMKEPKMAVCRLNDALCRAGVEDRFVTLIVTIVNPANNEVTIVNAGHMAPIVRRASGRVEEAAEAIAGLPLGIIEGFEYEQASIELGVGEWLALYTDGINEATNRAKEQYSIERIRDKILSAGDGPQALGKRLVDDVMHFLNGDPQSDDMCLVCFGRESTWGRDSVFDGEQQAKNSQPSSVVTASRTSIR